MGLFWDLIQHSQIAQVSDRNDSLERRLARVEHELNRTQALLHDLLLRLEQLMSEDIDQDGRIG
jgi:hypothetical protein